MTAKFTEKEKAELARLSQKINFARWGFGTVTRKQVLRAFKLRAKRDSLKANAD